MAKKKRQKKNKPKARNAQAYAASILCRRAVFKDRRKKRQGSRKDQDKAAIKDGWE